MMQVILKDVHFYCHHGLHAEEELTGGDFVVNLIAEYIPAELPVVKMAQSVDYTLIFQLVKQKMQQRTLLLETLVTTIALEVLNQFSLIEKVSISITKTNPPIANFQGSVGVSYELKR